MIPSERKVVLILDVLAGSIDEGDLRELRINLKIEVKGNRQKTRFEEHGQLSTSCSGALGLSRLTMVELDG
jgi:hypothetical protein